MVDNNREGLEPTTLDGEASALASLREAVEIDTARMREMRRGMRDAANESGIAVEGIGGMNPGHTAAAANDLRDDRQATVGYFLNNCFVQKVEWIEMGTDEKPFTFYGFKIDKIAVNCDADEDSAAVSWTRMHFNMLANKPGDIVTLRFGNGRVQQFKLVSSATFNGHVLPDMEAAAYALSDGKFEWETLDGFDAILAGKASGRSRRGNMTRREIELRREKSATAGDITELGEIIELADDKQRSAMQFAYDRHAIIEGPPGSGKSSVALMRAVVLINEQRHFLADFDANDKTTWRYGAEKTRVLVASPTMVPYLQGGLRQLRQSGIRVETLQDFFHDRAAAFVAGPFRAEPAAVTRLKAVPGVLPLVWQAFQRQAAFNVDQQRDVLRRVAEAGPIGRRAVEAVVNWATAVSKAQLKMSRQGVPSLPSRCNLHRSLASFASEEIELEGVGLATLAAIAPRMNRLGSALSLEQFSASRDVFESAGLSMDQVLAGAERWREQAGDGGHGYCEADTALGAVLAAAMGEHDEVPMTHAVVDEAQDLTQMQALALRMWMDTRGVVTAVGDLRQALGDVGLRQWDDLQLRKAKRAAFKTNYRQTWEIGRFIRHLHVDLFEEQPVWKPSTQLRGTKPRFVAVNKTTALGKAAADEVSAIRKELRGATVAVVADDGLDDVLLTVFDALEEVGIDADIEPSQKLKNDTVLLLSAGATKGLEFDAVVYIGHASTLSNRMGGSGSEDGYGTLDHKHRVARHRLYVALSRARNRLSIVTRGRPALLQSLSDAKLCDAYTIA